MYSGVTPPGFSAASQRNGAPPARLVPTEEKCRNADAPPAPNADVPSNASTIRGSNVMPASLSCSARTSARPGVIALEIRTVPRSIPSGWPASASSAALPRGRSRRTRRAIRRSRPVPRVCIGNGLRSRVQRFYDCFAVVSVIDGPSNPDIIERFLAGIEVEFDAGPLQYGHRRQPVATSNAATLPGWNEPMSIWPPASALVYAWKSGITMYSRPANCAASASQ